MHLRKKNSSILIRHSNTQLTDSFNSDVNSVTRDSQELSYMFLFKQRNNNNNQKSYICNSNISEKSFYHLDFLILLYLNSSCLLSTGEYFHLLVLFFRNYKGRAGLQVQMLLGSCFYDPFQCHFRFFHPLFQVSSNGRVGEIK